MKLKILSGVLIIIAIALLSVFYIVPFMEPDESIENGYVRRDDAKLAEDN